MLILYFVYSIQPESSWNDSVLTKEEMEARTRRKVEAVMKRERALAYAYSHQVILVLYYSTLLLYI
jgi:hypothetical protein